MSTEHDSPLPPRYNLRLYRGDDWSLAMRFMQVNLDGTRTPRDVTSLNMVAQIRAAKSRTADLLADITVDKSLAADGVVVLKLTDSQIDDMDVNGIAFWDFQVTEGDDTRTHLRGDVTMEEDVSS